MSLVKRTDKQAIFPHRHSLAITTAHGSNSHSRRQSP